VCVCVCVCVCVLKLCCLNLHLFWNYCNDCICFGLIIQAPRESLLFVIPAFGGTVSWEGEGAPFAESDQSITHQVCVIYVT
jgi:hypothetical protein